MKLIKLETSTGKPIWINPAWVVGLHQAVQANRVQVDTGEGDDAYYIVTGILDEVAAILMGDDIVVTMTDSKENDD